MKGDDVLRTVKISRPQFEDSLPTLPCGLSPTPIRFIFFEVPELGGCFSDFLHLSLLLAVFLPLLGRHSLHAMPGGRVFACCQPFSTPGPLIQHHGRGQNRIRCAFSLYLMVLLLAARCAAWDISPPRSIADLKSPHRLPHFRLHFHAPIPALYSSARAPIDHFLVLPGRS